MRTRVGAGGLRPLRGHCRSRPSAGGRSRRRSHGRPAGSIPDGSGVSGPSLPTCSTSPLRFRPTRKNGPRSRTSAGPVLSEVERSRGGGALTKGSQARSRDAVFALGSRRRTWGGPPFRASPAMRAKAPAWTRTSVLGDPVSRAPPRSAFPTAPAAVRRREVDSLIGELSPPGAAAGRRGGRWRP